MRASGTAGVPPVWRGVLAAALVTSLVFALAAFLATLLIGARYEARSFVALETGSGAPAGEPILLALAESPTFANRISVRTQDDAATAAPRLPERIVEILDGATLRETRAGPHGGTAESVVVERSGTDGRIAVTAQAETAASAVGLADAVADEIAEWLAVRETSRVPAADGDEIERGRRRVDGLQARLASVPETGEGETALGRRASLTRAADELDDALREVEARASLLERLRTDPAGAGPLGPLRDEVLGARVLSYRVLDQGTRSLELSLAQDSPRLRIARTRLAEIGGEIEGLASAASQASERDRAALRLRLDNARGDIATLDEEIGAARERALERGRLAARLAEARDHLSEIEALAASAREPVPRSRVVSAERARASAPPVLLVTGLAGLAGLFVGALGGSASAASLRFSAGSGRVPFEMAPIEEEPDGSAESLTAPLAQAAREPDTERTSLLDLAGALAVSPVTRLLVAAVAEGEGEPASLRLARRLAADGNLVLLVDLSERQAAARGVGLPEDVAGFSEVVAGSLGLSSVTVGDDESAADLVARGRTTPTRGSARDAAEILDRVRGAYDHVIVDCGSLPADTLAGLADSDCAVLLTTAGSSAVGEAERLRDLGAAGLTSVLLAEEGAPRPARRTRTARPR